MLLRDRVYFVTVFCALLVGALLVESQRKSASDALPLPDIKPDSGLFAFHSELPDFSHYQDINAKKSAFFDFLLPLVEEENQRISTLRDTLVALSEQQTPYTESQQQWLLDMAVFYRVVASNSKEKMLGEKWTIENLLRRVDQVPPSLALAQAANESAWGTSRFAEKGNNLFGQWCFKKGCGLVPNQRIEGANHEVARFKSPLHSVQRYIHNLNTNLAYRDFRRWREQQRQQQELLVGVLAATTLTRYSTRGEEYVNELQAMIRINDLQQYDTI